MRCGTLERRRWLHVHRQRRRQRHEREEGRHDLDRDQQSGQRYRLRDRWPATPQGRQHRRPL